MAKHFHCPVNGWDCPYYRNEPNHHCLCTLKNPVEDCDDFAYSWEDSDPEAYTDDHETREGLRCPSCEGRIIEDDCLDNEHYDYRVELEKCGTCQSCGKEYFWFEEYGLKRVFDLKEGD